MPSMYGMYKNEKGSLCPEVALSQYTENRFLWERWEGRWDLGSKLGTGNSRQRDKTV